jgi:hypothetical protein
LKSLSLSFLQRANEDPALIRSEDPNWLSHIKSVIAMHKPATFSLSKLYDELLQEGELGEHNGEIITMEHLRLIYTILAKYSRSDLLPKKMTQTLYPQYSAAVPIVLLAYKEQFGVEYKKWKLNHDFMNLAVMGSQLKDIVRVTEYLKSLVNPEKPDLPNSDSEVGDQEYADSMGYELPKVYGPIDVFDFETQREFRELATSGGNISSTAYTGLRRFMGGHPLSNITLSKFYWCMLTQTWIFDPKIRHPDMITNLLDWDTPAKPLEEYSSVSHGFKIRKPDEYKDTTKGFGL